MTQNNAIFPSDEWFENDRKDYNDVVQNLPVLSVSNTSPEVLQHLQFQGGEIARLRQTVRGLAQHFNQPSGNRTMDETGRNGEEKNR
jgi:hypothetical protein